MCAKRWRAADDRERSDAEITGGYWRIGKNGDREWVRVQQMPLSLRRDPPVVRPEVKWSKRQGRLW